MMDSRLALIEKQSHNGFKLIIWTIAVVMNKFPHLIVEVLHGIGWQVPDREQNQKIEPPLNGCSPIRIPALLEGECVRGYTIGDKALPI